MSVACESQASASAERSGPVPRDVAFSPDFGHRWVMQYRIRLIQSEEGWAVSCPSLPGCRSQGATREVAVENIKTAIREWWQVEAQEAGVVRIEQDFVAV